MIATARRIHQILWGIGSVLDIMPSPSDVYLEPPTCSDAEAIAGDWAAVGRDIEAAKPGRGSRLLGDNYGPLRDSIRLPRPASRAFRLRR